MYNLTFKAPQSYKKYRYVVLFLTTFLNNPVVIFFCQDEDWNAGKRQNHLEGVLKA